MPIILHQSLSKNFCPKREYLKFLSSEYFDVKQFWDKYKAHNTPSEPMKQFLSKERIFKILII